jgi:glucose/arabinose dehydrogenase
MKRILALLLAAAAVHAGTPQEANFTDASFASGLDEPTCIAWVPDGSNRLFVSLKSSGIAIVENGALRGQLFATFPNLYTVSECGVLGLAFDPDYATNRYVYVFVTVSSTEQQIVRFTDQANVGTQRTVIIPNLPTHGANHDGGALAFGPDGRLYWAIGDLGDKTGVDGNLSSLAAKVGRANKDGSVPNDNPFADGPGGANDYIWATGFRNPFTMTFQPGTGKLWLNVVGSTPGGQTQPNSTPGYEQVYVVNAGDDGGYDDFEGNQPTTPRFTTPFTRPCIRPKIQYKTGYSQGGGQVRSFDGIRRNAGIVSVTTSSAHPYRVGQALLVSGTGEPLDGTYTVQSIPSATTFTAKSPGANAIGGSGSVDLLEQGSSITGGTFYTSTAFPATYRGNFFYGDYVGGSIMRAQLDDNGKPSHITRFIDGAGGPTDTAVGPDGALYYSEIFSGQIRRVAFDGELGLVVSPTTLNLVEGGSGTFAIQLGSEPSGNVTVQIHKTGDIPPGTHNIDISGPAEVTFTPENWDIPQTVTLTATEDEDSEDDTATFEVTAPGFDPVEVAATANDENLATFLLSTNALEIQEGKAANIAVSLMTQPAKAVVAHVRPGAGPKGKVTIVKGAMLRFTPANWNVPQTVRVRGVQDPNVKNDSLTLLVKAPGLRPREFAVTILDNEPSKPVFTSAPKTTAVVNLLYAYDAEASGLPAPTFSLLNPPAGMTIDSATGLVQWTPTTTGTVSVTVRATNSLKAVDQEYMLVVGADQAPTAFIIAPKNGDTISGTNSEFFGGSTDDYGTYKAEFSIDGQLVYTDTNREAHYHLNGAHNLFDTTTLTNGQHTLLMKVYDDAQQVGEMSVTVTVAN